MQFSAGKIFSAARNVVRQIFTGWLEILQYTLHMSNQLQAILLLRHHFDFANSIRILPRKAKINALLR